MEHHRNTILEYGKEMSDLIIMSYTALSEFSSHYESWRTSRMQLIGHVEELLKNLRKCAERNATYAELLRAMHGIVATVDAIPNPFAILAGRVVAMITGLFSTYFAANSNNVDTEKSNTISIAVFRDAQASGDLYSSGLQCHQQFEETTKLIEKFHAEVRGLRYYDPENGEMTAFIEGLLEYKPNHRTFYLKLQDCLRELSQNISGDFGRKFYEPFSYNPSAVEVVRFLKWRFRYREFNPESVRFGMEQLRAMIQDNNNVDVDILLANVNGLLELLKDELSFIETCVEDVKSFSVNQSGEKS